MTDDLVWFRYVLQSSRAARILNYRCSSAGKIFANGGVASTGKARTSRAVGRLKRSDGFKGTWEWEKEMRSAL